MAQQTAHIVDARYSTSTDVGRDQITNYYGIAQSVPSSQSPSSLSFNDAPIDLLSSHFTGREDDLDHIVKVLGVAYGNTPTRCAVHGMQGMGKTQLALQYAMRSYHQQQYSVVFWISGATVEKLNQGLVKVLTLVGHPDRDHPEQSTRLTSARRWLEESTANGCTKWLLIFDNVAQEAVGFLKEHLPRKNVAGNILLTTRTEAAAEAIAAVAGQQHHIIELCAPDIKNAAKQLLKEAGIDASDAGSTSMDGAQALVKCVGCLPLAITHAASLARQSHKHLDYVLRLYQGPHKFELMGLENNLSNYEQKSVAVTFGSQLKELESQSPDCSNLLRVLSFFDPEGIPLDMITEGVEGLRLCFASDLKSSDNTSKPKSVQSILHNLETKLQRRRGKPTVIAEGSIDSSVMTPELESLTALICSPVRLQQAIQYLRRLSLVGYKSTEDTSALRIHDLIQIIIQESARRDGRQYHWFHVATVLACSAFQLVEDPLSHSCWAQCEMFHPHIQSLTKWDDEHTIGNSKLRKANIRIGQYLKSRGRYSEAVTLFMRALTGTETLLGPEHPDTLTIVQNIGSVYWRQGRYTEAETLCKRALRGREKVLGSKHPNALETMHTLATVYRLQGRFVEAEKMYGRALANREKLLGLEHPDTLQTVNSLAVLYHVQDRYSEAETLFRRALEGREKLLGPEHKETLGTVNNLAMVCELQGRFKEAEALYGRALEGQETRLGHEHPNTLRTVQNLACTYHLHQRYSEAETLYQRALTGRNKVLGSNHPDTLVTVREFTKFFKDQNRHEEAIILQNGFPPAFQSQ